MTKLLAKFALLLAISGGSVLWAQSTYIPLHNPAYHTVDRIDIKIGELNEDLFTSVKPYTRFYTVLFAEWQDEVENTHFRAMDRQNQFYIYKDNSEWSDWGKIKSKKPLFKHIYKYKSDFLYVDKPAFMLKVNPVLHFQFARSFKDSQGLKYINTRGVELRGMISEKVGFYTFLSENQAAYPDYAMRYIGRQGAIPGEKRFKNFNSRIGDDFFAPGTDFFNATGYVTFQPVENIRLQFGHDQNFIGNGMRSLILSDFSGNYLFLKVNTKVWKLNYQNLFMELTGQFTPGADELLPKKYAAIHHLSINLTKWLNVGVFESVVYGRENGFELNYLNPIIFFRAVEYHLGSADNVLLGLDYKANFLKRFSLYGQFVLDEYRFDEIFGGNGWWGNKFATQIGLKYIDVAGVTNLDAQIEYNSARPYTYSHNTVQGNYSHYNLPLAHPLGANFREVLGRLHYKPHKDLSLDYTLMYARQGLDRDTTYSWGGNILADNEKRPFDTGNKMLQGVKSNTFLSEFNLSFMWKHNLSFDATYIFRRQSSLLPEYDNAEHYVGLGMRLNISRKQLLF